jgi:hypothetical protein
MARQSEIKQALASQPVAGEANGQTPVQMGRQQLLAAAKAVLPVTIDGMEVGAERRQFRTGSLGWSNQGKLTLEVGGQPVKVQVNINLIVVGSKDWPQA